MKRFFVIIYISLFALAVNAASNSDRFVKKWEANCKGSFGSYQLIFESASGDPTEDDMSVKLKIGSGSPIVVAMKPALYFPGDLSTNGNSQCSNVSAVSLSSGNILVFVQRDNRPSEDHVAALLLSGSDGKLLDTVFDLGAKFERATLSEVPDGVRMQLIRKWQTPSPTTNPLPIVGWLKLTDVGGNIKYGWE